jgi:hypothetical protein
MVFQVRARLFRYAYAPPSSPEAQAGQWWLRSPAAEFLPALTLEDLRPVLRRMGWD